MVYYRCCAPGCTTKCGQGLILRGIPEKGELRQQWLCSLPSGTKVTPSSAICELHFETKDFEKQREDGKRKLKWHAVPSVWRSNNSENVQPRAVNSPRRRPFGDITNAQTPPKQPPQEPSTPKLFHPSDHPYSKCYKVSKKPKRQDTSKQAAFVGRIMTFSSVLKLGSLLAKAPPPSFDTNTVYLPNSEVLPIEAGCLGSIEEEASITNKTDLLPLDQNSRVDQVLPIEAGCPGSIEEEASITNKTDLLPLDQNSRVAQVLPIESGCPGSIEEEASITNKTDLLPLDQNSRVDQDARLAAMQVIVAKQEQEIQRLLAESKEKTKAIKLLERKLSTKYAIQRKYDILKSKFERVKKNHSECVKNIRERFSRYLREDQITALLRKSTRGLKWCSQTIRDGFVLKWRCGTSGFAELLKKVPIYPSVRSLQSFAQFVKFDFGLLEDIFTLMEAVVPFFNVYETDCHLTIDEMAIEPGERVDFSLKKWVGMATLKSHVGTAKKALVFLLSGVSTRWKQVVGVHLTTTSRSR